MAHLNGAGLGGGRAQSVLGTQEGNAESGIMVVGSFPSHRSALVSSTRFWLLASAAARALMASASA